MPTSSGNLWKGRVGYGIYELLLSWWRHRVSFLISLGITIGALALYYFVFFGEKSTPLLQFIERFEQGTLDTRFRARPANASPYDPRIVIVDIDQKSQEVLGKWPFSRSRFAEMLDVLKKDGAKVVAFDVTFDKPDNTGEPVRALWAKLEEKRKQGEPVDPKLESEVRSLAAQFDADAQFAKSIDRFEGVVLGNFFLPKDQLKGIDTASLDAYNELIEWYAIGRVPVQTQSGKEDFENVVQRYGLEHLLFAGNVANIPAIANPEKVERTTIGFFNAPADADGVVRRTHLVLPFGRSNNIPDWQMYGSLEVQAVRLYLGLPSDKVSASFGAYGVVSVDWDDKLKVRTDFVGRRQINYHGPKFTYPYYSIADVLQGKVPGGAFKDKIVLVGASAIGIGDLRSTPYTGNDYPGVEIHANVIDNILHDNFLIRGPKQQILDVVLVLLFGLPLGFALALVAPRWMWFGMALLVLLVAADYLAFLHGWWLNFTVPAITLTSNVVLVSLYRALIEEKEKRRVRSEFAQFVPPEVMRRLLLNPELVVPRKTEITIMFSDIRGFTTISEKLDAQDLALFLNQYLSDMSKIVFDKQGTLDKFIGDAVMAFWGAPYEEPGHESRACEGALDMIKRINELQKQWEAQGKPRLDIGIGLNTGVASVGKMGSLSRAAYTALGDSVNLASRLEGLNKDYGTHILVTESTYEATKQSNFTFRELDLIRVKGKLQPVIIYELVGHDSEVPSETKEILSRFAAARAFYQARKWQDAQNAFQSILEKWPADGPSRTYWKRCQEYLFDEPPLNWDGVFTMDHK
ncbi:MAG TPA: adenylate/guanylate cyclase domain-containing protein [Candidatus Eremiobacteraceae bacterium]|nr:adenylate/guanylate cyclase domain-containing protein [Candidatus Eremiobacteraceae bacterium]